MISLKMNPHVYHNIHNHKYTAPFHPLEVSLLFFWENYKYFNVSWLLSNPLQLLAAMFYHSCHKFDCHSNLCFDFYYVQTQTQLSGAVQVLHPGLSAAAGTSPNSSLSFTTYAMGVPGSCLWRRAVLPRSSLCCQQLLQLKQRQLTPGDKSSVPGGSWGVRWQLPAISLQQDCLWALQVPNVFLALRELSAPSPPHRSQGHLVGVLWGSGPTGSGSISSLSGGV